VLRHSGFKLQIVALPLLCVVPSIDFFFQTVLNTCLVLFSDTSLTLVIILIAAVTTSTFTYHISLSLYTQIFIFEFFSIFCIIFMIVIINDKICGTFKRFVCFTLFSFIIFPVYGEGNSTAYRRNNFFYILSLAFLCFY